jgi:hypothetical protein
MRPSPPEPFRIRPTPLLETINTPRLSWGRAPALSAERGASIFNSPPGGRDAVRSSSSVASMDWLFQRRSWRH